MLDELAKVRFARFTFHLRAHTPLRLPAYKGSTLRGGFGISFKEAVCVVGHRDCDRCILRSKCAYPYIFETPIPDGSRRMAHYEHAPHPFVIEPPLDRKTAYAAGDALEFGLVLIGRAIDYLPYFIFAFEHLGHRNGIGKAIEPDAQNGTQNGRTNSHDRGKFSVEEVSASNGTGAGVPVYDGRSKALQGTFGPQAIEEFSRDQAFSFPLSCLKLTFVTPTRLIFDPQLAAVPEFHIPMRNLVRHLANLAYFHCGAELDLDFHGLVEAAQEVRLVESRTHWHDWERYAARQDAKLKMGGVIGEAVYEGAFESFEALLALGEVLHVGKGTGLGLGWYQVGNGLSRLASEQMGIQRHLHR